MSSDTSLERRTGNYVPSLVVRDAEAVGFDAPLSVTGRELTNAISQDVTIVDASGNQITDFGGDKLPTSGNNPSTALSYDVNGDLQYIDETINGTVYRTTLTYSSGVLVGISEAVAQ